MATFLIDKIQLFSLISVSVFLEAIPFLLLGATLSALFEVFVPEKWVERMIPKNKSTGILFGISLGLLLPTCECGVVPVVKKLLQKGFPAHVAISYMLSSPVINPVVLASTYVAFRYNHWMLLGRVGLVVIVAAAMGWIFSSWKESPLLKTSQTYSCGHEHQNHSKLFRVLSHITTDFFEMGKYFILGAFVAAAFQTFLPQNIMAYFGGNLFLAILAMMILAMLLSVCSHADAFIAATFTRFPLASQLSFVAIGPMIDIKLLAMYSGTFKKKAILLIVIVPTVLIFTLSSFLGMFIR